MSIRNYLAHKPSIGENCYIDPSSVVIGRVEMGADCSVWPTAVIRGDVHDIQIGRGTNVQDGAVLHVTHKGPYNPDGFALTIGEDVTIGHQATLHGCTIGNRCLIGLGARVMDGAVVEDEVIIGAGSLVTPGSRLVSGHLYVGSPAKQVRALKPKELEFLSYSAKQYIKLKNDYLKP